MVLNKDTMKRKKTQAARALRSAAPANGRYQVSRPGDWTAPDAACELQKI